MRLDIAFAFLAVSSLLVALGKAAAPESFPSVWMMQVRVDNAASPPGFMDNNGVLIVRVQRDVRIQLSGSGLDQLTHIAFTAANSTRNSSSLFPYMTPSFVVTEKSYHYALATVNLVTEFTNRKMYLVICINGNELPIYQALELLPTSDSSLPQWVSILFTILLLSASSLFSGLTLGLMSLDRTTLKVLRECGSESEKRYSRVIEPLRKHGNYLLCTLVLGNVFVNSCLSILLSQVIGTGVAAVAASTFAIVIFGEILPQAFCSRYGLLVGAKTRYLTIAFMIITGIISWPLSKVLDLILGKEIGTVYDRDKLQKLLEVTRSHMDLGNEEVNIVQGALQMRSKKAMDIMTPIEKIFMIPYDAILDFNTMNDIFQAGYSRIPIYDERRENVVSILNLKDIAFIDPDDRVPLKAALNAFNSQSSTEAMADSTGKNSDDSVGAAKPKKFTLVLEIDQDMALDSLLQRFLERQCHMGFVYRTDNSQSDRDPSKELVGLVTLEDLFEEIIQREILDETDVADRDGQTVKRRRINLSEVNKPGPISVSVPMQIAAYQFLSTSINQLFGPSLIERSLLMALLKNKIVHEIDYTDINSKSVPDDESTDQNLLYRPGCPVDYFVLILQGRVDVFVGKEGMRFDAGPFTAFGEQTLLPVNELLAKEAKEDMRKLAQSVKDLPKYNPDYKVRATCDVQYVRIDRAAYFALRYRTITSVFSGQAQHTTDTNAAEDRLGVDEIAGLKDLENCLMNDLEIAENPEIQPVVPNGIQTHHQEVQAISRDATRMGTGARPTKKAVSFRDRKTNSERKEAKLSLVESEVNGIEESNFDCEITFSEL